MSLAAPALTVEEVFADRLRRWTPAEFRRMQALGLFAPAEAVTLTDGDILARGLPRLWNRAEYYQLANKLILGPSERTELLDGRIVRKMSMNPPHMLALRRATNAIHALFEPQFLVFAQCPIDVSSANDPEPDIMVIRGREADYLDRLPRREEALLVVEVSDSTLRQDRRYKAGLYARARIAEYWIVNVSARTVEVHRDPADGEYLSVETFADDARLSPLAAPNSILSVRDLLPAPRG